MVILAPRQWYERPTHQPPCFGRSFSAALVGGHVWAVTSFEEAGRGGIVMIREGDHVPMRAPLELPAHVQQPSIAADGSGGAVIAWSEWEEQGRWAVRAAWLGARGAQLERPAIVARGEGLCLPPAVAWADGRALVVWAATREGAVRVQVARGDGDDWALDAPVECGGDSFRPCLAVGGGAAHLAWDEYREGRYRVRVARRVDGAWEHVADLGREGERWLCPRIAALPGGEAILTWVVLREVHDDLGIAEHEVFAMLARVGERGAEVVSDPALSECAQFAADLREGLLAADTYLGYHGLRRNPQVAACAEAGSAWLVWEARMEAENSALKGRLVARRLDAGGVLSAPVCLHSGGYSYAVPPVAAPDTLRAAFFDDTHEGWDVIRTARLDLRGEGAHESDPARWRRWRPGLVPASPAPEGAAQVGGRNLRLFWADTHCHSVYCPDAEGEVDELIQFARDVAGLDAVAIVDNDYYPHKALTEAEWQVEQELARHLTREGSFVVFPAFEFTFHRPDLTPNYNHRTVMYARPGGRLLRRIDPWSDGDRKLAECLAGSEAMSCPHHCTWELVAPELEFNVEVVSSWRVCMEETDFVIPQLRQGAKFGFLGASDTHRSVPGLGGALTGIFAEALTPEALFEAYRARRTVATQGFRLWAECRVGEAFIGEETTIAGAPTIEGRVEAPGPLQFVEVIRDGVAVRRVEPEGTQCDIEFTDTEAESGEHFYFLRIKLRGDPSFNLPPGESLTAHDRNSRYPHNLARARGVFAWTSPTWVRIMR